MAGANRALVGPLFILGGALLDLGICSNEHRSGRILRGRGDVENPAFGAASFWLLFLLLHGDAS